MQGSKLVREMRDKKEASKSRARFWEVAGSKMGKITGALTHSIMWSCTFHFCSMSLAVLRLLLTVNMTGKQCHQCSNPSCRAHH